MHVDVAVKE